MTQKIHHDNYKYTKIAHGQSRETISRLERYSDVVSNCLEICFPKSGVVGRCWRLCDADVCSDESSHP